MSIGQAYAHILTKREQQALRIGCDVLIDSVFDDIKIVDNPKDIADTVFSIHLPGRYVYKYTPLFLRQFTVCIITVTWKLAQQEHMPLSSLAEELAAWAIINQAKTILEADIYEEEFDDEKKAEDVEEFDDEIGDLDVEALEEEGEEGEEEESDEPFGAFIEEYFEDLDFRFLFDDAYDGIDVAPENQALGIASLAFDDWFLPFSDEAARTAHPYVA
jgi:hypothetical protein